MTALVVILIIIALTAAFFHIPVYADIVLGEANSVEIGYMFFRKKVFPGEEKKTPKKTVKKAKTPKKSKEEGKKPKEKTSSEDFSEILGTIKDELPNIKKFVKELFRAVKIRRLYVNWIICEEDACETAINYGKYSGLFYIVYNMLDKIMSIKPKAINIYPDFLGEKSQIDVRMRVYISPAKIISATVIFAVKFMSTYLNKNKKEKVEKNNESRTSC